eukprot:scaffold1000_cov68-Phaeocystis_antarctica.AAC.1
MRIWARLRALSKKASLELSGNASTASRACHMPHPMSAMAARARGGPCIALSLRMRPRARKFEVCKPTQRVLPKCGQRSVQSVFLCSAKKRVLPLAGKRGKLSQDSALSAWAPQ